MEQFCSKKNKIAVVGSGPAGVYCALSILEAFNKLNFSDFSLVIFEKNTPLSTLIPTGNGRCNIGNSIADYREFASNYPRGEKFLYSIFSRYFTYDSLEYFSSLGIETYCQDDGRIFPVSNSSKFVRKKLLERLKTFDNVEIINKKINSKLNLKDFDRVIIASGSRGTKSLIEDFGHTCVEFKKSLCALKTDKFIYPKGVSVKSKDGDFIFCDNGISGPLAFKLSSINSRKDFPYYVKIKLFDEDLLFDLVKKHPRKAVGNLVSKFIPSSLAKIIVDDYQKNACEISKEKLSEYSTLELKVTGYAMEREIVHSGGVSLSEIDKNCKSKIYPNLWFCGEILDIDGFCGGFNLQNCWSTSWVVANDVVNSIIKE